MSNVPAASATRNRGRTMTRVVLFVASAALATASPAQAQTAQPASHAWEMLFSSGALVPTGAERSAIKDAALSTAQLSYVMHSQFAITTMVGWARSRDLASANDPKLDVFTYDIGAELRAPRSGSDDGMSLIPFAGVGVGSRSYNYRALDIDATHNVAGYGAVGGDLGKGRLHLRLEVRDYVTGFKPLTGTGPSATRNDVVALAGLRLTRSGE
ncbi:hypothetical protein BH09GEM1_BH09GEM1_45110 [soil metagenome]